MAGIIYQWLVNSRMPLTTGRAAWIIACVTVLMTIISGVLIHLTDKKNYPEIGDGLWWAIQTVTTVGYGDLVPTSTTGRLIAALVMVVGLGFLTVITAAILNVHRVRPAPPAGHEPTPCPQLVRSARV
jgi:voltage-gated potassium channel Kch